VQHPDLLLKHLDATLAIYKRRQIKHLRHAYEILAICVYKKTDETIGINACNIHVQPFNICKHPDLLLKYPPETIKTYI
jgi:hypothetical protein